MNIYSSLTLRRNVQPASHKTPRNNLCQWQCFGIWCQNHLTQKFTSQFQLKVFFFQNYFLLYIGVLQHCSVVMRTNFRHILIQCTTDRAQDTCQTFLSQISAI